MPWVIAFVLIIIIGVGSVVTTGHETHRQIDQHAATATKFCRNHQGVKRRNKYNLWCRDGKLYWWDNGEWGHVGWESY